MNNKILLITARTISIIFTPFYLPLVGLILLFSLSYLRMLPIGFISYVLFATYLFTILLPTVMIFCYRHYHGWQPFDLRTRHKRVIPYAISIASYIACYNILCHMRIPHFITSIIIAALIVQSICIVINMVWKISAHMAAIGGVTGLLVAYSFIFGFNPTGWLCLCLLLSGLLGTARMILRQHTLAEVIVGFFVGCLSGIVAVLLL